MPPEATDTESRTLAVGDGARFGCVQAEGLGRGGTADQTREEVRVLGEDGNAREEAVLAYRVGQQPTLRGGGWSGVTKGPGRHPEPQGRSNPCPAVETLVGGLSAVWSPLHVLCPQCGHQLHASGALGHRGSRTTSGQTSPKSSDMQDPQRTSLKQVDLCLPTDWASR